MTTSGRGATHGAAWGATRWAGRHAGLLASAVCAAVILGPMLLTRGFWLHYDMVFVPHLPLSDTTLGTAGQVPRAVPNDAIVALLDLVLAGDITQKIILLGAFLALGAGVDRWRAPVLARVCASVLLAWNPWVAERLAIGHWGYLWGYAACVWAIVGALEARRARTRSSDGVAAGRAEAETARRADSAGEVDAWIDTDRARESVAHRDADATHARRSVAVALVMSAASGSTGAVLVALALAAVTFAPGAGRLAWRAGWRPTLRTVLAWVGLNASWWWPFLTAAPSDAADAAGVEAFAARSDGAGPVWTSLLGGGGIWHAPSWFAERSSAPIVLASALVCLAGVIAARRLGRGPITALAVTGLFLAGASTVPGLRDVMTAIVLHVPGGGLLRDGQKFVALWVVPAALGWGLLIDAEVRRARGSILAPVALIGGIVAPLVLLPGLAWARGGQWRGVDYPAPWTQVARDLDAGTNGATLVLPWSTYRRYAWNGERTVLDPWNRLLTGRVIADDALAVRQGSGVRVVAGEDPHAAAVGRALVHRSADELRDAMARADVSRVIVQTDQPDAAAVADLVRRAGATPLAAAPPVSHLTTWSVPGATPRPATPWWRALGLATSIITAGVVIARASRTGRLRRKRCTRAPEQLS